MTIQDLLDANVELYSARIKIWDERTHRYIIEGEWSEEKLRYIRHTYPIRFVYVSEDPDGKNYVTFEVVKEEET